jgi:uncharacterized membrane protein
VKIKLELLINTPRPQVWEFFRDHEKAKLWQPSLSGVEVVGGTPGLPGAISKWTYVENEREFSLTEKILHCEEPSRFESLFENAFASNIVNNRFVEQSEAETLWVMEASYTFKTLLMKLLGPILRKNYVSRSQKDMERFKELVEKV